MPAYNEEKYLEECFFRVVKVLKDYGRSFEVILEEDGSTDRTPQIMDRLARDYPMVRVLHFPKRMGKGFGIKKCLKISRGRRIVLIDSDMEYPPERIVDLLNELDRADIAIGGRIYADHYKTKVLRYLASRIYGLILRTLFGIEKLYDPQSGLKAYRREVIEDVSPLISNGFEIDTEILLKAVKKGYRIGYISIKYRYKGNSKVNIFKDSLKMFISILKWRIKWFSEGG